MDDIETLIEDCENRSDKLSYWEAQFIDSMRRQVDEGRRLTDKQVEVLESIWEKVT